MLEIVSAASEFDTLPMRPGEDEAVRKLLAHAPVAAPEGVKYTDPHTKVNALLQAHFSRTHIAGGRRSLGEGGLSEGCGQQECFAQDSFCFILPTPLNRPPLHPSLTCVPSSSSPPPPSLTPPPPLLSLLR